MDGDGDRNGNMDELFYGEHYWLRVTFVEEIWKIAETSH